MGSMDSGQQTIRTSTHGGLSVHIDALKLMKRLATEDLEAFPHLKEFVFKVGADKAEGHKGQSVVMLGVTSYRAATEQFCGAD